MRAEREALSLAVKMRKRQRIPFVEIRPGKTCGQPPWFLTVVLLALLGIPGVRRVFSQQAITSEYQMKAAFLLHFAQFVEWPPDSFKAADSPLTYCTVGEDLFHGALEAALNGKKFGLRPFRVVHFKQAQEVQGCQVLFIGIAEREPVLAMIASLQGTPVLTVGDTEHFAQDGGMIGFCLEENKVRFEINLTAAEHARLRISARLLALAKTVIGGPEGI